MLSASDQGTDYLMPTNEYINIKKQFAVLEDIDVTMHRFIDEEFNLHTTNNQGMYKVPVIWVGNERAYQVKNNRSIRDSIGKLKLPLISIERTSMEKDKTFKGPIQAHLEYKRDSRGYKNGAFQVVSVLNQEKTSQFANAKSRRINNGKILPMEAYKKVYDTYYIPIPTYVKVIYTITLRTEYQQQMNDLVTPFITKTGQINHFVMRNNENLFEAFIEPSFDQSNNLNNLGQEERKFETKISIKVLGHIVGDGDTNEERPKIVVKENIVEVKIPTESIMTEEELPWNKKKVVGKKIITSIE